MRGRDEEREECLEAQAGAPHPVLSVLSSGVEGRGGVGREAIRGNLAAPLPLCAPFIPTARCQERNGPRLSRVLGCFQPGRSYGLEAWNLELGTWKALRTRKGRTSTDVVLLPHQPVRARSERTTPNGRDRRKREDEGRKGRR